MRNTVADETKSIFAISSTVIQTSLAGMVIILVRQSVLICPMTSQFQISEMLVGCCCLFALSVNQEMLVITDELVGHLSECHVTDSIRCGNEVCKRVLNLSDTGICGRSPVYAYTVFRIFKQDVEHL